MVNKVRKKHFEYIAIPRTGPPQALTPWEKHLKTHCLIKKNNFFKFNLAKIYQSIEQFFLQQQLKITYNTELGNHALGGINMHLSS